MEYVWGDVCQRGGVCPLIKSIFSMLSHIYMEYKLTKYERTGSILYESEVSSHLVE